MTIMGRDTGEPVGICVWCWRTTNHIGQPTLDVGSSGSVPLDPNCAMQMVVIRRKMLRPPYTIGHKTLAERRYWRNVNVIARRWLDAPDLIGPGDW